MDLRRTTKTRVSDTEQVDHRYDRPLLLVTFILIGLGLVMIYSASIVIAETQTGNQTHFLQRQVYYLVPAIAMLVLGMTLHHDLWERISVILLVGSLFLLVLVFVPGIGGSAKGASRWIRLGAFTLQPSEILKVAFVLYLGSYLSRRQAELDAWRVAWLRPMMLTGFCAALLMVQPDFGSTVICFGMMWMMVWVSGGRKLHAALIVLAGLGLGAVAVLVEPYRVQRLLAFWSRDSDPQGAAYQINQALISFGSGNWTGVGLGSSHQKLLYLPDAHTDFIGSIIGEELGLVGICFVIVLYAVLVWRGWRIAWRASTAFAALTAFGFTTLVGYQAVTNLAVVMALLPTKGLTLPLLSYGGSSLVMTCFGLGILLNISRREPPPEWIHRVSSYLARVSRFPFGYLKDRMHGYGNKLHS